VALPTLITVHGTFLKLDGTPEQGIVQFQSSVYSLDSDSDTVVVPDNLVGYLDDTGSISITIPATNDPEWTPAGWTYLFLAQFSNSFYSFDVVVPYDAPNHRLSITSLVPAQPGGMQLYAPYNHTHADSGDGGTAVDPASTVVAETSYGQATAVGVGTTYARADHSHGTPPAPTPAGIGASPIGHTHPASEVASGTLAIARIPTGTSGTTVALGNDSRFTNARTPTAHATTHGSAGADPVTVDQSQVTGLTSALSGKASATHNHTESDITGLTADLAGKANASHTHTESDITGLSSDLAAKAPTNSPTFTGTVSGITRSMVGLGNVDNTADADKPVSTATAAAISSGDAGVLYTASLAYDASQAATAAVAGLTKVLVLGPADPVPGGTAAGTVIVRRSA